MFTTNKQQLFIYSLLITATLLLVALLLPKTIHAATIEVNSTADTQANDGECTLREAIVAANTNTVSGAAANECIAGDSGADTINFNISGSGVHVINPASELPEITEALTIDGYTQTGASTNTTVSPAPIDSIITIEIDNNSGQYWEGLVVKADDVIIRGLAIDGFIFGVLVDGSSGGADNINIEGNYLGTDATGQSPTVFTDYVGVGLKNGCSNITIGGTDPEDRNIVAGSHVGIEVGCSSVGVFGNYIGAGPNGTSSIIGDKTETGGVGITQSLNQVGPPFTNLTIGGTASGQPNLISGNPGAQIVLGGNQNTVQGNIIGGDYTGAENANVDSGAGLSLYGGGSNMLIGGTGAGEGNIVVGTKGAAIAVLGVDIPLLSMSLFGQNNAILGNRIFEVGRLDYYDFGDSNIGIDLLHSAYDGAPSGPPENFFDTGPNSVNIGNDTDRANNYLRAPVLNSAVQIGNILSLDFDLDVIGSDSNQYRVEFYANDTSTVFGTGPGQYYLGSTTVDTGNTDFDLTLASSDNITNKSLSATVTPLVSSGPDGFGGTSEFSKNISIGSVSDFDADGIADSIENTGPNSGDANGDGTPDSQQPTVTTYQTSSGTYATLSTTGCSENGTVSSFSIANASATDNGYIYPYDLTDFTLNCSRGDTVNVELIIHDESDPTNYLPRKYNPNTSSFTTVDGATVGTTTIGSTNPLLLTYSITDGGLYDDDNEANGIIVDPIGLATELTETTQVGAPNTGIQQYWVLNVKESEL